MKTLTEEYFEKVAKEIGCEVAAIKAVAEVEAPKGGFDSKGRLTMLFEPHIFWKELRKLGLNPAMILKGTSKARALNVLSPVWDSKLYGKTIDARWEQFQCAKSISEEAAYKSCSWGKFQIMGFNFKEAGFVDVFEMVRYFEISELVQLSAFVKYLYNVQLDDELRAKDWKGFARQYNGPQYWKNAYDVKLAKAYNKHSKV